MDSIDFLKTSTEDGTVKEDDKESMEVASTSSIHLRDEADDQSNV